MNALLSLLSVVALAAGLALAAPAAAQAPAGAPAGKAGAKAFAPQRAFATPEDAASALLDAMNSDDLARIHGVLGPGSGRLIRSGDRVADEQLRESFAAAYTAAMKIERDGDAKATLVIGRNEYPFPFPLVKRQAGWMFDARAGAEEMLNRRIGENELSAINFCLAYVDAQREYVLKDRDRNGLLEYARKFHSTPGERDGLYWKNAPGEPESPLGPLAADAAKEGYRKTSNAYHGYHFKILTAQGKDAPGGEYDYVVKGAMIGGFALVAWPARWDASGVMTFMCNHDGVVYQKNLGRDTATVAAALARFNPDPSWTKVMP